MIPVDELLDWLKADEADADAVAALEMAAVEYVERQTGRRLGPPAEITEALDWRGGSLLLGNEPRGPVTLERWTGSGWEAVPAGDYYLDGRLVHWTHAPTVHRFPPGFRATYEAGYPPGLEPEVARQAVRMLVAHWYLHREAAVVGSGTHEVPMGVDMLLRSL